MKFESQHRNINKAFDDNIDAALANIYGAVDDSHARMAVDDLKGRRGRRDIALSGTDVRIRDRPRHYDKGAEFRSEAEDLTTDVHI